MDKKSIVAVLSGGLDSSTMLWSLQNDGFHISEVLTFDYGQRHKREVENAKLVVEKFKAKHYPVNHQIVDMSNIGGLIAKGSLTGNAEVPHETYDAESQKVTIVPNRNMIFLSIAAGRAISIEASHIGYAAHSSDYSVYPDCRPEFIEQLNEAIRLGNLWDPITLHAPFQHISKIDVVRIGAELGVPFELTWSCYEGTEKPCLQCGTCLERTEAFLKNDLRDPAIDSNRWSTAVEHYKNLVLKA